LKNSFQNTPIPFQKLSVKSIGIFLIVMHLFGFLGMQFSVSRTWFEALTPLNLLISAGAVLWFHTDFSKSFVKVSLGIGLSGFLIEVLGVKTELIFGKYAYASNLGWKVAEVPLLIGLNWWLLTYCFGMLIQHYFRYKNRSKNLILNSLITAFGMVLLDILIEPVAIRHGLWHWFGKHPPLQNYTAWLGCAFTFALFFHLAKFEKKNPMAFYLLIAQFLFFGGHNLIKLILN